MINPLVTAAFLAVADELPLEIQKDEFVKGYFQRHAKMKRLQGKTFKRVRASDQRGTKQAEVQGDAIVLYPNFFKLDASLQDFVFTHEIGHTVEGSLAPEWWQVQAPKFQVELNSIDTFPFGQMNMDEAFAETFAVMVDGGDVAQLKKQWTPWYNLIAWAMAKVGVS